MSAFDRTIDSLLPEWPPLTAAERAVVHRQCTTFARRQISLAPAHIRLGLRCLFIAFVAFAAARAVLRGSAPSRVDAEALTAFASLGPGACAGLERALRSMTVLSFLEHPSVVAAAEAMQARS